MNVLSIRECLERHRAIDRAACTDPQLLALVDGMATWLKHGGTIIAAPAARPMNQPAESVAPPARVAAPAVSPPRAAPSAPSTRPMNAWPAPGSRAPSPGVDFIDMDGIVAETGMNRSLVYRLLNEARLPQATLRHGRRAYWQRDVLSTALAKLGRRLSRI